MKKCAIIVAACKAQKWIVPCLKSIRQQVPDEDWTFELRVGVDGCGGTAAILRRDNIPYYWNRNNVGSYVMANSLMALGPADVYSRFDADDYMLPQYLATVVPVALQYGLAQAGYQVGRGFSKPRVGQVTFTAATLEALGGFAEYRCHCDRDFTRRAAMAGMDLQAMRSDPRLQTALFIKGIYADSLTHNYKYGHKSIYRRKVRAELTALRETGRIKIVPKTVELKWQP